jgi:hypothetical protein
LDKTNVEVMMSVNKGKGTKGRSYDELSGVGTSRAGVTGIKDTLSDLRSEGAFDTEFAQEGSRQSADLGQSEEVPGEEQQNRQSEQGGWSSGGSVSGAGEQGRPGRQGSGSSNPQGGSGNR